MPRIVLIVDDEKATRDGLRMALEEKFDCYVAADATQARQILQSEPVDIPLPLDQEDNRVVGCLSEFGKPI